MKILHTVESYLPARHGMSEVVRQLSEIMVEQGHEVFVATSYDERRQERMLNGVNIESFKVSGNYVNGIQGESERYIDFVKNSQFDVVTNFAAQQWATDLCLEILPELSARKVFVPTGFSGLFDPKFSEYFEKMKQWMKHYDMNVFLSDDYRDIDFARTNDIARTIVIPNGASRKEFEAESNFSLRSRLKLAEDSKLILHVGSYTDIKGQDEALDIFMKSKVENATLVFIGKNFNQALFFGNKASLLYYFLRRPVSNPILHLRSIFRFFQRMGKGRVNSVWMVSLNRQEVVAAYNEADLVLFPSKLECSPIVLFESMASKTPFLVTDVGNSKEIVEWSEGGIILPTKKDADGFSHAQIEESALIMDDLLKDQEKMEELGNNGFQAWDQKFTWEKIAERYLEVYSS